MWKQRVLDLVAAYPHPAWGLAHVQRVAESAQRLADETGWTVNRDTLWIAAHLHDLGALEPYRRPGINHAERSAEVVAELAVTLALPAEQLPLIQESIRAHDFTQEPSPRVEAVLLRDADLLDFMGAIGIARLLAIVGQDDWTPDLPSAIHLIRRLSQELPDKLTTAPARRLAITRQAETVSYLSALSRATRGLQLL